MDAIKISEWFYFSIGLKKEIGGSYMLKSWRWEGFLHVFLFFYLKSFLFSFFNKIYGFYLFKMWLITCGKIKN